MNRIFDIRDKLKKPDLKVEESALKTPESNSKALRLQFDAVHLEKLKTLKMLCGRLPDENEVFFLETTNSFNAFTFIVYLIKHAGRIDDLFIGTYSINQRILDSLSTRISENEIGNICLYIAESIRYRMPKVKDRLDIMTKEFPYFQVEYAWTHKKVIAARVGDACFVVEGSGNFSENSAEEQYIFLRSKRIYEFRIGHTE
jgi:hypothetical protein